MNYRVTFKIFLAFTFALLLCSCDEAEDEHSLVPIVKYKLGDHSNWAKIDLDDGEWSTYISKNESDIFWVRTTINFNKDLGKANNLGLYLAVFGAYETYWDGVLIGKNGELNNEENKTGEYHRYFILPDSLTQKGKHTLALRASQKYDPKLNSIQDYEIHDYFELVRRPLKISFYLSILAGAFLITAIYIFILYYFYNRSFEVLLFSIANFLFFLFILLDYLKFYVPFHYSYFYTQLELKNLLSLLISFVIPLYFSIQFSIKKNNYLIGSYLILLVGLHIFNHNYGSYDELILYQTTCMWLTSLLIAGYGFIKKIKGAFVLFMGLLMFATVYYLILKFEHSLILSFVMLLSCMLYIFVKRMHEQRQDYEYSLVQGTRLNHQLLKKKIRPNFLINTLSSIIDYVEDSPKKGVKFIEALVDDFHLFHQIEDKKLISIKQEIQLCKNYINIMQFRKNIKYVWNDYRVDENEKIPPALIYTLLENGITHCTPLDDGTIRFELDYNIMDDSKVYTFTTFAKLKNEKKNQIDGTGNKYIKSRLTESYNSDWSFKSEPIASGWQNVITLYLKQS